MRTWRVDFQEIAHVKWHISCEVRLKTARGRRSLPLSDFREKHRAAELLHERIGPRVQDGWEAIQCRLGSMRANRAPRQYNQFHKRLARFLLLGPVLGIIAGVIMHSVFGRLPELGWKGNFLLFGPVAGLGASLLFLVFGAWMWWMDKPEKPEETPTQGQ